MKNFVDSSDEYEQAVKNQKRQKSKKRGKTEEKYLDHKSKIFINCKDTNQLNSNDLILQKIGNNSRHIKTENNIDSDILNLSFCDPSNKSSKVAYSSIIDENENGNINNENENSNIINKQNKLNLVFSKKFLRTANDDIDNKIFSFNENIKKHKESKTSKFSNFDANVAKEMTLNNFHRNNVLNNYNDQKVLVSSRDFYKNKLKTNDNFFNENSIKISNTNSYTNNHLNYVRRSVNNSEKINLNKLYKNKKYDFSDEEDNSEEDENDYEDIKKEYSYASSSGSEVETKKEKDEKISKSQINKKEKKHKSSNYARSNNRKLTQSEEKCRKTSLNPGNVRMSLFKKSENDNNNRISRKFETNKIYKKSVDMKISQKNDININDYFISRYNMYNSSACTLAKEIDGEKCQNEDSYLIKENIFGQNFNVYGVFDGHGKDSHKISKKIAENMGKFFSSKKIFQTFLDRLNSHENNGKNSEDEAERNGENGEMPLNLYTIKKLFNDDNYYFIKKSVKFCESRLKDKEFNLKFAGSTCVMLFLFNDKLICSNIGDSRCVLFKCTQNDKWSYINLSNEHKPTNEEEKKRILKNGGEIHPFIDEKGNYEDDIQRIWVKDKQYPGLALSRSIGDLVGRKVGIISVPTIVCKKIDNRSKFIILGSDGFWDVVGFSEIINIVKPHLNSGNPENAAKKLVEKAKKAWSKISGRDDITVIVIFISADLAAKYETNMNVRISGRDN